MPRYFLHIHDNRGEALDLVGVDLPDLDAARDEAMTSARDWIGRQPEALVGGRVEVVEGYSRQASLMVDLGASLPVKARASLPN